MRSPARVLAALALLVLVVGAVVYLPSGRHAPEIAAVELAGSAGKVASIVAGEAAAYATAVRWDFAFIPGYVGAIVLASVSGMYVTRGRTARWSLAAGVAAGLADVVENVALLQVLTGDGGDTAARVAQVFAAVKFALLVFAVPAALTFLVLAVVRGGRPPR
jgi:hypothetical protein